MLASKDICIENICVELHRQWLARVSSSCASLVSPLVTKSVDPDWSVSSEGTDRNFHLLSIHLALFNKRLCHPSLIYCPSPFNCVVHSTGDCSIILAWIPWPVKCNSNSLELLDWVCYPKSNLNKFFKSLQYESEISLCKMREKLKREGGRRLRKERVYSQLHRNI